MHLSAVGHGGKRVPNFGLTASLFGEGLQPPDVGELAIEILTRNAGGVLRVQKPVEIPQCTGRLMAGLRDEGDIAHLRQTGRLAVMRPDRIDLMERDEQVSTSQ